MDQVLEKNCLALLENYQLLSSVNKMESSEMILACSGIFLSANAKPDPIRMREIKKLLKSKAGIFSDFRGADELLILCKMALASDPNAYFERLKDEYLKLKTFFSGEQTVLAAMILADQGNASEGFAEKTKQIYQEMKDAHPWLTSESDLPFAALMAISGKDPSYVYQEAEQIYSLLKGQLRADKDTLQMLSHILAIRKGPAAAKCEKLCSLATGLKAAKRSLGTGSRLAILGVLADAELPVNVLVDQICETDDYLKQHKPFKGLFGVGEDCRRMFAVQMVQGTFSNNEFLGTSMLMSASVELVIMAMITMMVIVSTTAASSASSH